MAHHYYDSDSHKNRVFDGYGQPAFGVRPAAIVGYHATVERYMATSEEVVSLSGGYLVPTQIRRFGSLTRDQPNDYSPKFGHTTGSPRDYSPKFNGYGSPHDSPRNTFKSSPPEHNYSGKYDSPRKDFQGPQGPRKDFHGGFSSGDDDGNDDDVECRDGVCYPKQKHGGYGGGEYHQPRKESQYHHQTSEPRKYDEGSKNNMYTHTKPVTVTDPYYDNTTTSKNDPYYGKSNNTTLLAPIKTRAADDHNYHDARNSPISAAAHRSPFGAASPRKDRREVIYSTESPRRYTNAPPHAGDHKYKATIDCETAAKLYGGVFV